MFCSIEQYEARYGAVADKDVLRECLGDSSAEIASILDAYGIDYANPSDVFADKLMRVCRSMTNRIMPTTNELPAGVTQTSITGGVYSQSYSFAAPYGTPKPLESELEMLGIPLSYIGSIRPKIGGERCTGNQ